MDQDRATATTPLDEEALRRPGFRPGRPVTLADGQDWNLPCPEVVIVPTFESDGTMGVEYRADLGPDFDRDLATLLGATTTLDEAAALLRVGVDLLRINYDLAPADFPTLLRYRVGGEATDPTLAAIYLIATGRAGATPAGA